ncbi:regulator of g protein signaling [Anaeramoeba flamelloides]|uniref:Regulator of g protein signaling n=1 Tax=Anaeramoeba flamelloides TaxID=1746091 RepID=A0AAV7ZPU8_9EUKA|nr:regulator of g protein signaling [Anaeramoeba flamelloides]
MEIQFKFVTFLEPLLFRRKLESAKRMYINITANTASGSKTSNSKDQKSNMNEKPSKMCNEYLDTLDLDVKLREVEKQFFKRKTRIYERFMPKALSILFLFFHLVFFLLTNLTDLKLESSCEKDGFHWGLIFHYIVIWPNILVLVITTFLIRKIKDTYKTKNEINMSIINLCLYILFLYLPIYPESNYDHIRWEFVAITLIQFTISFAYPIYWSTRFEKTKKQIKKDNQLNGANNSSTFQKFQKIIEGAETVQYWINYSKLNYSVENILFYRTFKAFKSLKKNKKKKKYSKMIEYMLKNFIENNSPLIINISSHVRNNIINTCKKEVEEEIPDNVFDAAFNEIVNLMFTDTWPQFLESKLYFEMILKVEQINPDQYLKLQNIDADEEQEDENNLNLNKLNLSTRDSSSSIITEEEN